MIVGARLSIAARTRGEAESRIQKTLSISTQKIKSWPCSDASILFPSLVSTSMKYTISAAWEASCMP